VQQSFLAQIESKGKLTVGGRRGFDREYQMDGRRLGWIFCGAFVGLDSLLQREDRAGIGFGGEGLRMRRGFRLFDALRDYGFIDEFLNRLTGVIRYPDPTIAQLERITVSRRGPIAVHNRLLDPMGVSDAPEGISHCLLAERKFTVPQAAKMLGIGETKMRPIIKKGGIPVVRIMGKTLLLDQDLEEYLRSGYGRIVPTKGKGDRVQPLPKHIEASGLLVAKRRTDILAVRSTVEPLVRLAGEVLTHWNNLQGHFHEVGKERALQDILRGGTSAGGARAKAVIARNRTTNEMRSGQVAVGDGFDYWLLKFVGVAGNKVRNWRIPRATDPVSMRIT
jgi:excisionase family DNA binding protein